MPGVLYLSNLRLATHSQIHKPWFLSSKFKPVTEALAKAEWADDGDDSEGEQTEFFWEGSWRIDFASESRSSISFLNWVSKPDPNSPTYLFFFLKRIQTGPQKAAPTFRNRTVNIPPFSQVNLRLITVLQCLWSFLRLCLMEAAKLVTRRSQWVNSRFLQHWTLAPIQYNMKWVSNFKNCGHITQIKYQV